MQSLRERIKYDREVACITEEVAAKVRLDKAPRVMPFNPKGSHLHQENFGKFVPFLTWFADFVIKLKRSLIYLNYRLRDLMMKSWW